MNPVRRIIFSIIAAAMTLPAMAALDLPVKNVNGVSYYYYEVKPKESIYSLSKKIGVTRADIMRCNPAAIDGLRPGQLLLFPVSEFGGVGAAPEVCPEEIAPAEAVELPAQRTVTAEPEAVVPKTVDVEAEDDEIEVTEVDTAITDDDDPTIRVAVMLPFMLSSERPTKAAENYTEFYRGLLMAVDTVAAADPDVQISVSAFDTEGSADRVAALLNEPDVRAATYIIAPDDSVSIERIAAMADGTGAMVVNLFAVRNDAQERHPSVYQANIPQEMMYNKAVSAFIKAYEGYTPVIISATDIPADKRAFVDELRLRLTAAGISFEELEFTGELSDAALSMKLNPGTRYVFVPDAASREMLTRILDPLAEARSRALLPDDVRLFGYPEWIILRGEQARKLHALHTAIYSRFASDSDSYPTRRVGLAYEDLFGMKMANAVPVYGLLGFDAGRWMLGENESYVGLQNSFVPGSVNSALYFVYFSPDGHIRVKFLD